MNKKIFTVADLTEEFFKKVIYIERSHIDFSGMAPDGRIIMITQNGIEYKLEEDGYDVFCPYKTVPLLKVEKDLGKNRIVYCAEKEGWTYARGFWSDVLIRDNYYDKVMDIMINDKMLLPHSAIIKLFDPEYEFADPDPLLIVRIKPQKRSDEESKKYKKRFVQSSMESRIKKEDEK